MDLPGSGLMAKYVGTGSMMTINLLSQALASTRLSYARYLDTRQSLKENPALMVTVALSDARFFCELLGWCALLLRRLRHETEVEGISNLLENHKGLIDGAYEMRKVVNHSYNEDLADSYRTGNYKQGLHRDKFVFVFKLGKAEEGTQFTLGTTLINMDKYIRGFDEIEKALLTLNVPRAGTYKKS